MPTERHSAYLFLGEEDFLKEEAVEKLKARFLSAETEDLNYSMFYGGEKDFNPQEMFNALNTLPFLSKKRLVVLKDADAVPSPVKEAVLSYLCNPKESTVFVVESALPVIKGEFILAVSKIAQLVYYRRLQDAEIDVWLVKKAGAHGKKILPEAVKALKENIPNSLRTLCSNMDNIILYVGARHLIAKRDVECVTGISPSHSAFDLINSIEKKDVKLALRIFSSLRRDRKREIELLGLLGWNARMILRTKALLRIRNKEDVRRDLGLNPRTFDQIVRYAASFKKDEIFTLMDEILRADIDIKTGMPPAVVIEKLIVKMC